MNLETYYSEALRTLVPRGLTFDLNHSVIGLVTEIGEVATLIKRNEIYGKPFDDEMRAHLAEELGDICWYIPCGLQALGYENFSDVARMMDGDPRNLIPFEQTTVVKMLVVQMSRIIRSVAALPHRGGECQKICKGFVEILYGIMRLCQIHSLDFHDVLAGNIAKLRARYPEKFTPELAEARLDKGGKSSRES